MAFVGADETRVSKADLVLVLIESSDADKLVGGIRAAAGGVGREALGGDRSARLGLDSVQKVIQLPHVDRVQSKKRSQPHLTGVRLDIGQTATPGGPRQVHEIGEDVLIAVIDSGFDLTHPMFLDSAGKPRVEGLLVQSRDGTQQEFTAEEVAASLAAGTNPALDTSGHGTHVAGIAGGTSHKGFEGIAPAARFLLVKTNFLDTDRAVRRAFDKAKNRPCVINMSLGHHFGAHDGSDVEERLHERR